MGTAKSNHYEMLGLRRDCTLEEIRIIYRVLAKQLHPDLNSDSSEAVAQTQTLNAAYETLINPERRKAYDESLAETTKADRRSRSGKTLPPISKDVHLRIDEFFRGTTREVTVIDPGHAAGRETYELVVPPETAVGTRFRLRREVGGMVVIRALALPHFQFKVRGADLRCDLKIGFKRAEQGGDEMVSGPTGNRLRLKIPPRVARGELIKISGEGLPRPRGGRGDLIVRVMYQPQVKISRNFVR